MPVITSAIKKLRQDRKREKENDAIRYKVGQAIRAAEKVKSDKKISEAFSLIDKAAKKHLIHKNKAARMKSSLVKSAPKKAAVKTTLAKSKARITSKASKATKKKISKKK